MDELIPGRPGQIEADAEVTMMSIPNTNDVRLMIDKVVPFQIAAEIIQKLSTL